MVLPARKPAWIAFGCALLFHVLLLSLQTNQRPGPGFIRVMLIEALAPMEKLVDVGVHGVWNVWDGYIALIGVRNENERLRAENGELRIRLHEREERIKEGDRLRAFLGIAESGIGKTVAARVIGRTPSRSFQTVTIDKGQAHGVRQNAPVLTPDGVVGRVIQPGSLSAVVQLITDAQSEIGTLVGSVRTQAVFKGNGGRDLELDYIDGDEGIAEGDDLITSGLDRIYPKGLPLAVVYSVGARAGMFKVVKARPRADMARLEEVLVIILPVTPAPEPAGPAGMPATLPSD